MVVGIPAHVADANGQTVAHAYNSQLGDGILLKEFGDKFGGVSQRQKISCRTEVFFGHCYREVDDEDKMADDAPLEGSGVLE